MKNNRVIFNVLFAMVLFSGCGGSQSGTFQYPHQQNGSGEPTPPPPNSQISIWSKTYPGTDAYFINKTDDGNFAVCGRHYHNGSMQNQSEAIVYVIDSDGNAVGYNYIENTLSTNTCKSIYNTSDGGFIVANESYTISPSPGYNIGVLKLSSSATNIEWRRDYSKSDWDRVGGAIQSHDGEYVLSGTVFLGEDRPWMIKLDGDGNQISELYFGGPGDKRIYSFSQTSDGGYVFVGESNPDGPDPKTAWFYKMDSSGNKQFEKVLGVANDEARSVQQASDGGYILAGKISGYLLTKLNRYGEIEWQRGLAEQGIALSVKQTAGSGYVYVGGTDIGNPGTNAFISKTDSLGNQEWKRVFGGSDYDFAWSVELTNDGGYIFAGSTRSLGSRNREFWVTKLDSNGNTSISPID